MLRGHLSVGMKTDEFRSQVRKLQEYQVVIDAISFRVVQKVKDKRNSIHIGFSGDKLEYIVEYMDGDIERGYRVEFEVKDRVLELEQTVYSEDDGSYSETSHINFDEDPEVYAEAIDGELQNMVF